MKMNKNMTSSETVWAAIADLAPHIESWLDIGTGHGGVLCLDQIQGLPNCKRRAAVDIAPIRNLPPNWETFTCDARELLRVPFRQSADYADLGLEFGMHDEIDRVRHRRHHE